MKKDYTVVDETTKDEIAFVEDFWTRRWESPAAVPEPGSVAGADEFKVMAPSLAGLPRGDLSEADCHIPKERLYDSRERLDCR